MCAASVSVFHSAKVAGEPDDVAKTHKVKEKKDGAPEKTLGFIGRVFVSGSGPTMARRFWHLEKNNAIELNFGQPDFDYWYLLVSTGVPPIFLLLMMMMPTKTLGQTWWMRLTPETMAFSGCSITSGVGKGLVVDTGMSTRTLFAQSVLHTGAAED